MVVEAWGTGRRDYSSNTEASVDPTPRSYQTTATCVFDEYISAKHYIEKTVELDFAENADTHHIHYLSVTADTNVLIAVVLYDENGEMVFQDFGYQIIEHEFPHGIPVKEITVAIYNYSNEDIHVIYSHNGVQNTKTMRPNPFWMIS